MKEYGNGLTYDYEVPQEVIDFVRLKLKGHWAKEPTDEQMENLANDAAYDHFCDECSDDSRYWPNGLYGISTALRQFIDERTFADYGKPIEREYSRGIDVSVSYSAYCRHLLKVFDELCTYGEGREITVDDLIDREMEFKEMRDTEIRLNEEAIAEQNRQIEQYRAVREKEAAMKKELAIKKLEALFFENKDKVSEKEIEAAQRLDITVQIDGFKFSSLREKTVAVVAVSQNREKIAKYIKNQERAEFKPYEVINKLDGWDRKFLTDVITIQRRTKVSQVSAKQLKYLDRACQKAVGFNFGQIDWRL
jgi:hypothetical protein